MGEAGTGRHEGKARERSRRRDPGHPTASWCSMGQRLPQICPPAPNLPPCPRSGPLHPRGLGHGAPWQGSFWGAIAHPEHLWAQGMLTRPMLATQLPF